MVINKKHSRRYHVTRTRERGVYFDGGVVFKEVPESVVEVGLGDHGTVLHLRALLLLLRMQEGVPDLREDKRGTFGRTNKETPTSPTSRSFFYERLSARKTKICTL